MTNTYEVPVLFAIRATSKEEAVQKIEKMLEEAEQHDQLPPFGIGEVLESTPDYDGDN